MKKREYPLNDLDNTEYQLRCVINALSAIANALGAGVGVPIVLLQAVALVIAATLPANKGVFPFPLRRGHAVKGIVRLALYGRQALIDRAAHASPPCGIVLVHR